MWLPPSIWIKSPDKHPRDVGYVFGLDDAQPQKWLPPSLYLCAWMVELVVLTYLPAHLVLRRIRPPGYYLKHQS